MGIKLKVDERGRITVPAEIREKIGIRASSEVTAEEKGEGLLIYRRLSPAEFIEEARAFRGKIKATKVREKEPLKARELWKDKP